MYTSWSGAGNRPIWIDTAWSDANVRGTFSFRRGGVSSGSFDSLNVGLHVNDGAEDVLENRNRVCAHLGGEVSDWAVGQQVHGTNVHVVRAEDRGRGSNKETSAIPNVDALVTNVLGITLAVMAADCVPILFYDPVRHVAGACHSGWKGTVGHIASAVIETMTRVYGTDPGDVRVSLGPSIRQCCYEVNHVVRNPVVEAFGPRYVQPRFGRPGKYLLSLQSCIRADLLSAGVRQQHVEDSGVCTSCHRDVLFSHRADGGQTGRQLGGIRIQAVRNQD